MAYSISTTTGNSCSRPHNLWLCNLIWHLIPKDTFQRRKDLYLAVALLLRATVFDLYSSGRVTVGSGQEEDGVFQQQLVREEDQQCCGLYLLHGGSAAKIWPFKMKCTYIKYLLYNACIRSSWWITDFWACQAPPCGVCSGVRLSQNCSQSPDVRCDCRWREASLRKFEPTLVSTSVITCWTQASRLYVGNHPRRSRTKPAFLSIPYVRSVFREEAQPENTESFPVLPHLQSALVSTPRCGQAATRKPSAPAECMSRFQRTVPSPLSTGRSMKAWTWWPTLLR